MAAAKKAAPKAKAKAEDKPKRAMPVSPGRPSIYTPEMGDALFDRIATTKDGLRKICSEEGMPALSTLMKWLADTTHPFVELYARAKAVQQELQAEYLQDIHDKAWVPVLKDDGTPLLKEDGTPYMYVDKSSAMAVKIESDNQKWLMSKLSKRYGDKIAVGGAEDLAPIRIKDDSDLDARVAELLAKQNERADQG